MPFYEYECANCKFYMEVMQKITDTPLTKCPSCGQKELKKLVSAPVFRLKGGGWYETDFKSDSESKRNLAEGEKSEKAEGAGTEVKAAAATATQPGDKAAEPKASPPAETTGKREAKPARSARKSSPPARKPLPKRAGSKARAKSRSARKSRR